MANTKTLRLTKNFFKKERREIPLKASLKDVIPVEWVSKKENRKSSNNTTLKYSK